MSANPEEPPENEEVINAEHNPTLNYKALKELEGTIVKNFYELVIKVILINGKPYKEWKYVNKKGITQAPKITVGRKKEYLHLIKEYAIIEFIGIKCHIIAVADEDAKKKLRIAKIQKHIEKI